MGRPPLDKPGLIKKAVKAIEKHKLFFITQVPIYIGMSKAAFYNHKMNDESCISDLIEQNRISRKTSMLNKWYESENSQLQIACYKMLATEQEAHRLNGTKQIVTQEINHTSILEELEAIAKYGVGPWTL